MLCSFFTPSPLQCLSQVQIGHHRHRHRHRSRHRLKHLHRLQTMLTSSQTCLIPATASSSIFLSWTDRKHIACQCERGGGQFTCCHPQFARGEDNLWRATTFIRNPAVRKTSKRENHKSSARILTIILLSMKNCSLFWSLFKSKRARLSCQTKHAFPTRYKLCNFSVYAGASVVGAFNRLIPDH